MANTRATGSHTRTTAATTKTVISSLGRVNRVEANPRLLLPCLPPPLAFVTAPPITQGETQTHANQAPSAPATDKPTAVRHLPRVRRQHCRGKIRLFHKMLVSEARSAPSADRPRLSRLLVIRPARRPVYPVAETTQLRLPQRRAHGLARRLTLICMALFRHWELALWTLLPPAKARGLAHWTPPPLATRRTAQGLLSLRVNFFSEGVLPLHLPAMWWRSV